MSQRRLQSDRRPPTGAATPAVDPRPTALRRFTIFALLAAGVAAAAAWYGRVGLYFLSLGPWGPTALVAYLAAAAAVVGVATVRPVAATLARLSTTLDRARTAIPRHPTRSSLAAAAASLAFLCLCTAGRTLHPYVHDEFSYLIQAHQFARGRPWMPAHPLARFFDSFQLLNAPVYASAYFPGTALLHVPGVWLHVPPWVTSLAVAAAVGGLLFRVALDLLGAPAAVAAVLLLWSDGLYRTLSVMTLAQLPVLMWGLVATVAWLNWRATRRPAWAALVGTALGLAAITRPLDAVCFAVPILADVLAVSFRPVGPGLPPADPALRRTSEPAFRRLTRTWVVLVAAAAPWLALQLSLDRGITGQWTRTPFGLYADRDYPGTGYGFHRFDPAAGPRSPLPQKRALFDQYLPAIRDHTPAAAVDNLFHAHGHAGLSVARLPVTLAPPQDLPLPTLLPLSFVALAGLTRRRAVVLAVVPLFVAGYAGYVFFFPHYAVAVSAAAVLAVLTGAAELPLLLSSACRRSAAVVVPLAVAGMAVAGLPQFDPGASDDLFAAPLIADVNRQLATISQPAVVLFAFDPARDPNAEPVYNADVAWPDDAPTVRAHDLGPARDADLFAYFAARQPARVAYRYDERTLTLTPLGPVAQLGR